VFLLPYPPEYTEAYNALVAFRNKILTDLVGARVQALLEAGHEGMAKYQDKLKALGVTTYLFNDLQRKALVFKLHDKDLGSGESRYAKTNWLKPETNYPLTPPYIVPQRPLPEVDIFSYTARTPTDIKEMSGGAQLQGLVALQVPSGSMKETPDAENALYDYYFLYPQDQYNGKYTPTAPILYSIEYLTGESTTLWRQLRRTSDGTLYNVSLTIWFDVMIHFTTGTDNPTACVALFGTSEPTPESTLVLSQYRVSNLHGGFWGTFWTLRPPSLGWFRFSSALDTVTDEQHLWSNHFLVTLSVNNPLWGHTSPAEGTYTKEAGEEFIVTAVPEPTHSFDHWELDGVDVGSDNPYSLWVYKPCELKAIFT